MLRPGVESIHSRKHSNGNKLYLVRFAGKSFQNCDWVEESQLLANEPNLRNKLKRFDTMFDNSAIELEMSNGMLNYDPENVVVDRILSCSEIFMMIHPKKTSEITHKWTESLLRIIRVLLNFRLNGFFPGHFYLTVSTRFANFPELVDCIDFDGKSSKRGKSAKRSKCSVTSSSIGKSSKLSKFGKAKTAKFGKRHGKSSKNGRGQSSGTIGSKSTKSGKSAKAMLHWWLMQRDGGSRDSGTE